MTKSKTQVLTRDDQIRAFSNTLALETYKLLKAGKGVPFARQSVEPFLKALVTQMVLETLHDQPKGAKVPDYDYVEDAFLDAKLRIQNAISSGMEDALSRFSGHFTEYYCIVKPVPEPSNDLSN
jgi:hypothetical protein